MSAGIASASMVRLDAIEFDPGTQSRVAVDPEKVAEYRDEIEAGAQFPPVLLFHDGSRYWLGDGTHRAMAYRAAGRSEVPAEVRPGGRREAILHAVGANADHGLPRTNADKRKAVSMLLPDPEWSKWSDGLIAKQCAVTQPFVSKLRSADAPGHNGYGPKARVGADGKTYNVDGRKPAPRADAPAETIDELLAAIPFRDSLGPRQRKILDANAALYLELLKHNREFVGHAEEGMQRYGTGGPYGWRTKRFVRDILTHPRDWVICPPVDKGGCAGTGEVYLIGECPKCDGCGFLVN